jgi:hypothetical protein
MNTGRLLSHLVLIILGEFPAKNDASFLTNLRVFQCRGARVGKMLGLIDQKNGLRFERTGREFSNSFTVKRGSLGHSENF